MKKQLTQKQLKDKQLRKQHIKSMIFKLLHVIGYISTFILILLFIVSGVQSCNNSKNKTSETKSVTELYKSPQYLVDFTGNDLTNTRWQLNSTLPYSYSSVTTLPTGEIPYNLIINFYDFNDDILITINDDFYFRSLYQNNALSFSSNPPNTSLVLYSINPSVSYDLHSRYVSVNSEDTDFSYMGVVGGDDVADSDLINYFNYLFYYDGTIFNFDNSFDLTDSDNQTETFGYNDDVSTWQEYVNSEYNDGSFALSNNFVTYNGEYIYYSNSLGFSDIVLGSYYIQDTHNYYSTQTMTLGTFNVKDLSNNNYPYNFSYGINTFNQFIGSSYNTNNDFTIDTNNLVSYRNYPLYTDINLSVRVKSDTAIVNNNYYLSGYSFTGLNERKVILSTKSFTDLIGQNKVGSYVPNLMTSQARADFKYTFTDLNFNVSNLSYLFDKIEVYYKQVKDTDYVGIINVNGNIDDIDYSLINYKGVTLITNLFDSSYVASCFYLDKIVYVSTSANYSLVVAEGYTTINNTLFVQSSNWGENGKIAYSNSNHDGLVFYKYPKWRDNNYRNLLVQSDNETLMDTYFYNNYTLSQYLFNLNMDNINDNGEYGLYDVLGLMNNAFTGLSHILMIELFPNFTFAMIFAIPLFVLMIIIIFKLIRK